MENKTIHTNLKKWNWGAFAFTFWWGIGHNVPLTFLTLIPILNIIWPFVCGIKGNAWAWKAGKYRDAELFEAVQAPWNRAAFALIIAKLIVFVLAAIYMLIGAAGRYQLG